MDERTTDEQLTAALDSLDRMSRTLASLNDSRPIGHYVTAVVLGMIMGVVAIVAVAYMYAVTINLCGPGLG